jgi:hypothetical protein
MNVVGSGLYMASATMYGYEDRSQPRSTVIMAVHGVETVAAVIEFLAVFGWYYAWQATYNRLPGRGWTLDDPDLWAMITIFIGALLYLIYNIQNLISPESYFDNYMYQYGDIFYFINSLYYLVATFRDDGWFWFMPLAGGFPDEDTTLLLQKAFQQAYVREKSRSVESSGTDPMSESEAATNLDLMTPINAIIISSSDQIPQAGPAEAAV